MTDDEIKAMAYAAGKGETGPREFSADLSWILAFARMVEAAERERWIAKAGSAYTEAHAIFNDPPSETPQVVRDVIEWHLHAMRANEQA